MCEFKATCEGDTIRSLMFDFTGIPLAFDRRKVLSHIVNAGILHYFRDSTSVYDKRSIVVDEHTQTPMSDALVHCNGVIFIVEDKEIRVPLHM